CASSAARLARCTKLARRSWRRRPFKGRDEARLRGATLRFSVPALIAGRVLSSAPMLRGIRLSVALLVLGAGIATPAGQTAEPRAARFDIQEATIDRIQNAIRTKQITTRSV